MTVRPLLEALAGTSIVLAFATAAIIYTVPMSGRAEAGEGCAGQIVTVSWYGSESGNKTASGLYFDGSQLLVAHKSLPFHTRVRFTYRGKSIVLPVEDRGPFIAGRSYDLSEAAARSLGTKAAGVAKVCAERL